jgi:hypothetical protein
MGMASPAMRVDAMTKNSGCMVPSGEICCLYDNNQVDIWKPYACLLVGAGIPHFKGFGQTRLRVNGV